MAWILTINVDADHVDDLTERLWTLGTNGVAEVPDPEHTEGLQLLAGFEVKAEAESARAELGGTVAPVDPTAWAVPETTTVVVAGHPLSIEAGQSFGHGAHPTTQLCLQSLEQHIAPGHSVLDVGCGSGVLSLAAKALGAGSVTAIDIDPAAIDASVHNASVNEIDIEVTGTPIDQLTTRYDVVVVNMLVAELEPLADDVNRRAGELVILSGALVEQAERWTAMFPSAALVNETTSGEWAGRVYRQL